MRAGKVDPDQWVLHKELYLSTKTLNAQRQRRQLSRWRYIVYKASTQTYKAKCATQMQTAGEVTVTVGAGGLAAGSEHVLWFWVRFPTLHPESRNPEPKMLRLVGWGSYQRELNTLILGASPNPTPCTRTPQP